ncbi:hypothetical protein VNO78_09545 [Psophocarpus tetragonolobus]|uniref:Uncharacterized protein n=1 Tax=Psophocarpus tetragonolobus TaxID=3891 RepID=A0AAN9T8A2_PSOTE
MNQMGEWFMNVDATRFGECEGCTFCAVLDNWYQWDEDTGSSSCVWNSSSSKCENENVSLEKNSEFCLCGLSAFSDCLCAKISSSRNPPRDAACVVVQLD